jgi:adenosylcobyric acid synthase
MRGVQRMNKNALSIMFQGTHSDAGKSAIATAFCRIFLQDGYKTAPFKSQNMALNSYITVDGKEIGRAQGVQAEAAGVTATTDMNPILIKPTRDSESQIVVHGKPYKNMKAMAYRQEFFETGLKLIKESFKSLKGTYERIVIEGAGSPAEVNLNDRELVNMRVAAIAESPVVLIGDIEKGGVFASLVGTLQLLSEKDRERVIGVVINKFRGDVSLLTPGLEWFEEYTGTPVLGVIPYMPNLNIDAEDSVVLSRYSQVKNLEKVIDIAVIQYPRISNFTDVDPFFVEEDCHVRFVTKLEQLQNPDLIILPGSKNTVEDYLFLEETGLSGRLKELFARNEAVIAGVCGGYQMLGEKIFDPFHVESPHEEVTSLGFIPLHTTIREEKKTILSEGMLNFQREKMSVKGYEIHMGTSTFTREVDCLIQLENGEDGCYFEEEKVIGTYFHGIFHNDSFRTALLNSIRAQKGHPPFLERPSFNKMREEAFDLLADHVRKHVNMEYIQCKMVEFSQKETNSEKFSV